MRTNLISTSGTETGWDMKELNRKWNQRKKNSVLLYIETHRYQLKNTTISQSRSRYWKKLTETFAESQSSETGIEKKTEWLCTSKEETSFRKNRKTITKCRAQRNSLWTKTKLSGSFLEKMDAEQHCVRSRTTKHYKGLHLQMDSWMIPKSFCWMK